ncbi:MAG: hypothetical protein WC119_00560 [Synergistaceae bacterium]
MSKKKSKKIEPPVGVYCEMVELRKNMDKIIRDLLTGRLYGELLSEWSHVPLHVINTLMKFCNLYADGKYKKAKELVYKTAIVHYLSAKTRYWLAYDVSPEML